MIPEQVLQRYMAQIQQQPDLNGCLIGLTANGQSRVAYPGIECSPNFRQRYVILEEVQVPANTSIPAVQVIDRGAIEAAAAARANEAARRAVLNASRVRAELTGMALSCGAMVASGIFALAGSATGIGLIAWAGFATAAISCVNATVRYNQARTDPDVLDQWDHNGLYHGLMLFNDGIGVVTGVAGAVGGARSVFRILQLRGGLRAYQGAYSAEELQAALRNIERSDEARRQLINAMRTAGYNGRAAAGNLLGPRSVLAAMNQAGLQRLNAALNQVTVQMSRAAAGIADVASGINGVIMSGSPSSRVGSASGSVNELVVSPILVHLLNRPQG